MTFALLLLKSSLVVGERGAVLKKISLSSKSQRPRNNNTLNNTQTYSCKAHYSFPGLSYYTGGVVVVEVR